MKDDHIILCIKKTEDKYAVFVIKGWKIPLDYTVTLAPGGEDKPVCTCTYYPVDGHCIHSDGVSRYIKNRISSDLSEKEVDGTYFKDKAPLQHISVYIKEDKKHYWVDRDIGDISLGELVAVVRMHRYYHSEGKYPKIGRLNVRNVLKACEKASSTGEHLDAAGEHVESSSDEKTSDKYDASLDDAVRRKHASLDDAVIRDTGDKPSKASKASPWKRKRPNPDTFYVSGDDWDQILYGLSSGLNVLITGPTGSGKSELCYYAAKALHRKLYPFNFGAMTEPRTSLIGATHFDKDKGTWFKESRFVQGVKTPHSAILLDEISRAPRDAFNILFPLLDGQGYIATDESEEKAMVQRAEGVAFIATANIGMEYTGTDALDIALKNRFGVCIPMSFPPDNWEVKILMGRGGISIKEAGQLVQIANHQRRLAKEESEFIELVSTRMLLAASMQVAGGLPISKAIKYCIENHFSDEGGDSSERAKIQQIVQKFTR